MGASTAAGRAAAIACCRRAGSRAPIAEAKASCGSSARAARERGARRRVRGQDRAGSGGAQRPAISLARAIGKNAPHERTPNQSSPCQGFDDAERDEIVVERALDQRPEVAAHPHIGLDARPPRRARSASGCSASTVTTILDIGAERQLRRAAPRLDAISTREERRVVDTDADALDRRHQHVALFGSLRRIEANSCTSAGRPIGEPQ